MNKSIFLKLSMAITSTLTILAAFPYELGGVAEILPTAWKPKVAIIGIVSTLGLRIWLAVLPAFLPPLTPPTETK